MKALTKLFILFCFSAFSQESNTVTISKIDTLIVESENLFTENSYRLALDKLFIAVDLANQINNKVVLANLHIQLGKLHHDLNDKSQAKAYINKALELANETNDSTILFKVYNSLGNIISDIDKNYEEGLEYYEKSEVIATQKKDTLGIIRSLGNKGWTFLDMGKLENAYSEFIKAQKMNNAYSKTDKKVSCDLSYLIGNYFNEKNELLKAEKHYSKAIVDAKKGRYHFILCDVYYARSKLYQSKGEFTNSINDLHLLNNYKDSIHNAKEIGDLEKAKAEFQLSQYENELDLARKEKLNSENEAKDNKKISLISILFSLFTLSLIYIYFSSKARKNDNDALKQKNKLLLEAKQKADNLNALKSQFISTITHELRTPLYGVIGITNLLSEDEHITENQKKLINSLKQSGNFLLKHINDVLKIGDIESKTTSINNVELNLHKLIKELEEEFNEKAKTTNNKFIVYIDHRIPDTIETDRLRLKEILSNLLDNAFKFTTNGNVWLRIKSNSIAKSKISITFQVEDDGVGISNDIKEIIFDKFYQANRGHKNLDGTGLGLSAVKYLLHSLDSKIEVESSLKKGSIFHFNLNAFIKNNINKTKLDKTESSSVKFVKRSILIAEDNKVSQIITKKMVTSLGHECIVCDNGLETLKATKKRNFDLVLMDLNMPIMDGITSAKHILEFNNTIPIVALTALNLNEIKTDCYAVGMLHAVNKPLAKKELKIIINKYSLNTLGNTA